MKATQEWLDALAELVARRPELEDIGYAPLVRERTAT